MTAAPQAQTQHRPEAAAASQRALRKREGRAKEKKEADTSESGVAEDFVSSVRPVHIALGEGRGKLLT